MALVFDAHKSHIEVKDYAERHRIQLISVPANGTGTYQTLDVGVFGVLKQKLRSHYRNFLEKVNSSSKINFVLKDSIRDFLKYWNEISEDVILSAWDKISGLVAAYQKKVASHYDIYADLDEINAAKDKTLVEQQLNNVGKKITKIIDDNPVYQMEVIKTPDEKSDKLIKEI